MNPKTPERAPTASELFQTHRIGWQDGANCRTKALKLERHPLLGKVYTEAYERGRRARGDELQHAREVYNYVPSILRSQG